MDIPLKSQPKVSTVNLVDESKFQFNDDLTHSRGFNYPKVREIPSGYTSTDNAPETTPSPKHSPGSSSPTRNYRLTRIYSETEKNNFDQETGHRLYDDGRIRPDLSRTNSARAEHHASIDAGVFGITKSNTPKIYSRSHNEYIDAGDEYSAGLEDEYIPGLDFGDLVYRWSKSSSDHNLPSTNNNDNNSNNSSASTSVSDSASNTPSSREQSYLDLKTLHAKVAPQPIRFRGQIAENKYSFSKLHDFMKLRTPTSSHKGSTIQGGKKDENGIEKHPLENNSTSTLTPSNTSKDSDDSGPPAAHKNKKQKSLDTNGDVDYEWIINSLPPYFEDLPYSQRKKLVASLSDSVDYSQFSVFAKNYFNEKMSGSSGRTSKSGGIGSRDGSFIRRSRRSSVNTVAGRLLALSSSSDLRKLQETKQKVNVDEKGAMVMEHELGKVIGFGAWGTIRECTDRHGTVRAMKIVKSVRDSDSRPSSPAHGGSSPSRADINNLKHHNPKVLQVFRKEIQIWKLLSHENVLPLLKSFETDNTIFCITNRIYGGTLFDVVSEWGIFNSGITNTAGPIVFSIEKQTNRLKRIVNYASQLVKALYYMHEEKGIVHGDVKLENVLVEGEGEDDLKMILCDFGMSRVYTSRLSRKSSVRKIPDSQQSPQQQQQQHDDEDTLMMRSKSSTTDLRRPYQGGDSPSTRFLNLGFNDDSKIGITQYSKPHGPSLQSVDLTPVTSESLATVWDFKRKSQKSQNSNIGIDSDLPHSHIGSLPYASPELLSPSPPPLGPSADIWALGVLLYTMCVGKLPFQHQYEPRLRAIITAGKFNRQELKKSCLMEWIFQEEGKEADDSLPKGLMDHSPSMVDLKRLEELHNLQKSWVEYKEKALEKGNYEFEFLYDVIVGCLEKNITKRWDLEMIGDSLEAYARVL